MLNVTNNPFMLNVIMLSVVAPFYYIHWTCNSLCRTKITTVKSFIAEFADFFVEMFLKMKFLESSIFFEYVIENYEDEDLCLT